MYHKPVCVKCQVEMRCKESGVGCLDMFNPICKVCPRCNTETTFVKEGQDDFYHCRNCKTLVIPQERKVTKPYKVWDSDLYECPKCGYQILTGFGDHAISEHYKPDFNVFVEGYRQKRILVENRG